MYGFTMMFQGNKSGPTNMRIFFAALLLFLCACRNENSSPPEPLLPVPGKTVLEWQEKELFAFIHFTVNTYTGKEWGYGDENPDIFHPVEFDPGQWATILSQAGFRGAILTAKHHDGFCLWPSRFTGHSVKNSGWREGKGDIVGDFQKACAQHNLEFGIYLSPWDRNHAEYASPAYVRYYQDQLKELLSNYGPVFEIWFDGANGGDGYYGGAREKRKIDHRVYYEWPETFRIVKSFNPETIIRGDARASCDSRWCGNEKGYVGETNWNMVSVDSLIAAGENRMRILNSGNENGSVWMPAEVDVSIRPGWFYHPEEDEKVKSADQLFEIYLNSVGRGSPLLLNIPPDKRGLIHEADMQALKSWKEKLDATFAVNLAGNIKVTADSYRGRSKKFQPSNLTDGKKDTYWSTNNDIRAGTLEFSFRDKKKVSFILIQEYLPLGQRIKSFSIDILNDNQWVTTATGTTIGYKRIIRIDPAETEKVRINILDSKACPVVSNVEIY